MSELSIEAEKDVLQVLIASPGWQVFADHMERQWGATACEQALRTARKTCDPAEWPFESARILDTFEGMRASFRWPEVRVRELATFKPPAQPSAFTNLLRRPHR